MFLCWYGLSWIFLWRTDKADAWWIIKKVTQGLGWWCFNQAHLMLASKYRRISKNAPNQLDGKPEEPETKWEKLTFWSVSALNVIATVGLVVVTPVVFSKGLSNLQSYMFNFSRLGLVLVAIIAGFILVMSVVEIRDFFKRKDALDFIDTNMFIRHATVFGLYLVGTTSHGVVGSLRDFIDAPWVVNLYVVVRITDYVLQLIS